MIASVLGVINTTVFPAAAGALVKKHNDRIAGPLQYMVGGGACACDWRWPDGDKPVWTMSSKDGVAWYYDGELNERGRQMLLEHFGLETIAEQLPLGKIRLMSPVELVQCMFDTSRASVPFSEHPSFPHPATHVA